MNRSTDVGLESSRAEEEPVTVAEAARRAGVHPNTVRRLIHRGALGALMIKGRHGDTWIVDAVELRRLVSGTIPAGPSVAGAAPAGTSQTGTSPAGTSRGTPASDPTPATMADAPARWDRGALPATVDLSLERAQALERYTHGLLAPLVELLRERETALERREEIVRRQAERIGRLEREVELLRAQLARAVPAGATESPTPALVEGAQVQSLVEGDYESIRVEGVHDEAVALASQVARLRDELRSLAVHLEERTGFAPARDLAPPAPAPPDGTAGVAPSGPEPAPERAPELANEAPRAATPVAAPPAGVPPPARPLPPEGPDPFAEAAAAIRQLQVALQGQAPPARRAPLGIQDVPDGQDAPTVQAVQDAQDVQDVQDVPAESVPAEVAAPETPPAHRPWWRFWR